VTATRFGLALACCVQLLGAHVQAATIERVATDDGSIIVVEGDLVDGDQGKLQSAMAGLRRAVVVLSSDGGNLIAGIEMGKLIRLRGLSTLVMRGDACTSACALAWLGGVQRIADRGARIGFHAAYRTQGGKTHETGAGNALVGAYLTNLGFSENAVFLLTFTPPSQMLWLDSALARRLGIELAEVDLLDVEPSAGPAPADLEARTADFMRGHWQLVNGENPAYLSYAARVYGDPVDYFGKITSREEILRQQSSYVQRWPRRATRPTAAPGIICIEEKRFCVATGDATFEAVSDARRKVSTGTFSYSFGISFADGPPRIMRETSSVTARDLRDLTVAVGAGR